MNPLQKTDKPKTCTLKKAFYLPPGLTKGGVAPAGNKSDPSHSTSKADAHSWHVFFNFELDSDDDLFNPFLRNPLPHLSRNKGGLKPSGVAEVHELLVSLEDILMGVTKRVKVTRLRQADKHALRPEERVFDVEVKKGWKEGTRITFPKEGHQMLGHAPNDLAFVIKEKKHAHFRRDGSHIVYTSTITLREVRCVHVYVCMAVRNVPSQSLVLNKPLQRAASKFSISPPQPQRTHTLTHTPPPISHTSSSALGIVSHTFCHSLLSSSGFYFAFTPSCIYFLGKL